MTPLDYEYLRKLLKDRSGLVLSADKQYLVESRLTPLARKAGIATLGELVAKLKANNERLIVDVVEAMTTNESFFYRDKVPFEHFTNAIMPSVLAARAREKRIRIWCAAASTGQEPYSLAMCLKEMKDKLSGWRVEILGTDLSTEVLEKAKVVAAARRTSVNAMVREFLGSVAAREQATDDARAALLRLVDERQGDLGKKRWKREQLYDR